MVLAGGECPKGVKPPEQVKLMVASFGTINSQAEVEGWLSDQLKPMKQVDAPPRLSQCDMIANPQLAAEAVHVNWRTRQLEYFRANAALQRENARRAQILTNLKTQMLSDDALRYTQMGREFLQAKLFKKCGKMLKVVDRGNMTIQQVEKQIQGRDAGDIASADCVLSVTLGDRETNTKRIEMDNVGTTLVRTTYNQPYTGKIRDLEGNVLMAFDGSATLKTSKDNVVSVSESDPARKLVEAVCEQIAEKIAEYFTVELAFKVKVPDGFDADDVELRVDGREVDDGVARVLAFEHVVEGTLDGCQKITKTVVVDEGSGRKTVKMNFKKAK